MRGNDGDLAAPRDGEVALLLRDERTLGESEALHRGDETVNLAALVVVGAVLFYLWKEGVATGGAPAGPNEMQFIQM